MPTPKSISRKDFIKTSTGISAALLLGCSGFTRSIWTSKNKAQPNILLILTDQQHIDTISAGGCQQVSTPALDYLSKSGTSFAQSYCPNPLCSPSRSSILTGCPASETGVYRNDLPIRPGMPNLGEWFEANTDYDRVYAGKWHIPGTHQTSIPGFRVLTTAIMGHGILGDTSTSRACEAYLRDRFSKLPFLMVASFMQPHDICEWLRLNLDKPDESIYPDVQDELPPLPENFAVDPLEPVYLQQRRVGDEPTRGGWNELHWRYYLWSYYRHVEQVDGEIGRILTAIHDSGYERNTVIIFTSDHGEGMAHHQNVRKHVSYDEAMKVPLIISCPDGGTKRHTDSTSLVTGMDIMPTLCDFAGIDNPAMVRGHSLRELLESGAASNRPYTVLELAANTGRVVRSQRFKYVVFHGDSIEQLFDMESDPGETINLASWTDYETVIHEHREMLREWEKTLEPAANLPGSEAWWRVG